MIAISRARNAVRVRNVDCGVQRDGGILDCCRRQWRVEGCACQLSTHPGLGASVQGRASLGQPA